MKPLLWQNAGRAVPLPFNNLNLKDFFLGMALAPRLLCVVPTLPTIKERHLTGDATHENDQCDHQALQA
jgi:hypothetical protein